MPTLNMPNEPVRAVVERGSRRWPKQVRAEIAKARIDDNRGDRRVRTESFGDAVRKAVRVFVGMIRRALEP